jgi:hypothetical protein
MKTIKALFGLFVIVAAFYSAWKLIPPYFRHYRFEDVVAVEALQASYSQKNEDEIREVVLAKARDLEIPITPQQIKVRRSAAGVEIDAAYTEYVDLMVRPVTLNFAVSSKNKRL